MIINLSQGRKIDLQTMAEDITQQEGILKIQLFRVSIKKSINAIT